MNLKTPNSSRAEYLSNLVRDWVSTESAESPCEIPSHLADMLLREEENATLHRDQWSNWEYSFSDRFHRGKLWEPEVSEWVSEVRQKAKAKGKVVGPMWPNGHRFAVCLSHDVDLVSPRISGRQLLRRVFQAFQVADSGILEKCLLAIRRLVGSTRALAKLPEADPTLGVLLKLEAELGVKSSYFFLMPQHGSISKYDMWYQPQDAVQFQGRKTNVAGLIRHVAEAGHDVGLHGSIFSARSAPMLRAQKEALEGIVGKEVVSTRQHYLQYDLDTTLAAQEAAGFRVDSTLGFNRNIGFRSGACHPYRMFHAKQGRATSVLELPLIIQDGALIAPNALEFDQQMSRKAMETLLERVEKTEGVLTLLFHPDQFDKVRMVELYRWFVELAQLKGAWVTSAAEIEKWWSQREAGKALSC